MKRSPHSILTQQRMAAAAARRKAEERERADRERARAPVTDLSVATETGLRRVGVDASSVEAILAFAAAPDAEARWTAARGSQYGWHALQEWATEARTLLD